MGKVVIIGTQSLSRIEHSATWFAMCTISCIFSIISFLMVINVAWLHSAARLGLQAGAPEWMKFVWGLSVPYFFASAMFWQAKRCLSVQTLVKRLLVPYFLWCWLGAVWSIALHGVQFHGWELLRYLGLQPGWDPAYQPMWFLRALFVVLLVETVILSASRFLYHGPMRKFWRKQSHQFEMFAKLRHLVFPVYVLHSMFISAMYAVGMKVPTFVYALLAVGCSILTVMFMQHILPRTSSVLFGGRK